MTPAVRPSVRPVLAAMAMFLFWSVAAAEPMVTPPALKAAFLYTFAQFAAWPPEAGMIGPLTICVFGDAAIADALDSTVKGRLIGGREVAVSRVKADQLRSCHVLYVTGLDPARTKEIINALQSAPVLTVSDLDRFAEAGGIIGLFIEGGKMRFAINVEASQRARLRLSSKLLSLANLVKQDQAHP